MVDHPRQSAQKPRPRQALAAAEASQRADPSTGARIAKALARAGVASRREAERFIAEGRVAVNGRVLDSPAVKIEADDVITVDGKAISDAEPTRLWRYHKPVGLLTTHSDPAGRPTVFETLPKGLPRVISVGRLDLASEGLLLLTNDGALARALEMPTSGWIRRYRVRAYGRTTQARLDALSQGVVVEGVAYGPIEARLDKAGRSDGAGGANIWLTVAITEGKNREVRRVLESIGLKVNRLIRLAYGPFALATLPLGAVEEVGPRVIRELLAEHIPPAHLPKGDKTAGPVLQTVQQRRRRASDPAGPALAPAAPAPPQKKIYKAGWAKPAPRKPVVKAGATKPARARATRKPKPKPRP
jgi:23S rRNA pseudouridine2605 synthase